MNTQSIKFQNQFEITRKKKVWALLYQIPIGILLIIVLTLLVIVFLHLGSIVLGIFLLCLDLFGIFICVYILPSSFLEEYCISTLIKKLKQNLKEVRNQYETLEEELTTMQMDFREKHIYVSGTLETEIIVYSPDHVWSAYIIRIVKEDLISKFQRLSELREQVNDLEDTLLVYYHIPEKTFWEYLLSKKWLKKQIQKTLGKQKIFFQFCPSIGWINV